MRRTSNKIVYATRVTRVSDTEPVVQSGLSLTPAEMYSLASQGKPIASCQVNEEYFNDGNKEPGFEVPIFKQRGVDVADVWNEEKRQNKRISKAYKQYQEQQQATQKID